MSRTALIPIALLCAVALHDGASASPSDGDGPAVAPRASDVVPDKAARFADPATTAPVARVRAGRRASGVLAGKTVYLSAGHGWMYSSGAWRTQRGNTHDLVEDFITVEAVNEYLIGYLHAMGAYVVPIRESDRNTNLVIVDDGDAVLEGDVAEATAMDPGWGAFATPIDSPDTNPFTSGGTRAMTAAATETGRVVFPATIPESGYYNVYVAYAQGPDRVSDAHVIVNHAGGSAHLRVDQRRHGSTWMLLGRWYFDSNAPAERASVAIANDSADAGKLISFDAVRFGGGMAQHRIGGATTERPAFESAAAYATQLLGAPRNVHDYFGTDSNDDIVARPRFAAWEHEAGEDAIYVAYHTNAPSPSRGTMSIAYGNTYPCCRGLDDFAGVAGSLELLHAVHDEILADVRAGYEAGWRDAGKVTASLGELNPGNNNEMPAILVELAFHDTAADADALRDPQFRRISARAMAQGIAKYFAAKDGRPVVLPPEPPTALRVENAGNGTLRVSWRPPADDPAGGDAPTGYRVYVGDHGYAFGDGVDVEGESYVIEGLPRAALRYVRVTAVNDGGESPPTEIVAARVAASGAAPVLVAGGYDRLDRFQMIREAAPLVGTLDRLWLDRMNNGTYAVRHAQALAAAGFAFDGATDEAIAERDIDLTVYKAIDWFSGEDTRTLPAATREELVRFFAAGGNLLLTGAELVWALDSQGTPEDQMFVRETFHVSLVNDDAETYDVVPLDGPFAALAPISFQDSGVNGYDAKFPDVLMPGPDAQAILAYGTGEGGTAGVAWDSGSSRGIVIGFPLELVQGAEQRQAIVESALAYFGVEMDPDQPGEPPVDPEDPDAGCGCASSGDASSALLFVLVVSAGIARGGRSRRHRRGRGDRRRARLLSR